MSVRAREAVRDHSRARGAARNVLNAIADRAGDDGVSWQDHPRLADEANVHARTLRRVLRVLEAWGELETRREKRGHRRMAYRLLLPGLDAPKPNRPPWELEEPWSRNGTGQSVRGQVDRGQVVPLARGQRGRSTRARSSGTERSPEPSAKRPTGGLTDERYSEYDR